MLLIKHANKQLVNTENWSKSVKEIVHFTHPQVLTMSLKIHPLRTLLSASSHKKSSITGTERPLM